MLPSTSCDLVHVMLTAVTWALGLFPVYIQGHGRGEVEQLAQGQSQVAGSRAVCDRFLLRTSLENTEAQVTYVNSQGPLRRHGLRVLVGVTAKCLFPSTLETRECSAKGEASCVC